MGIEYQIGVDLFDIRRMQAACEENNPVYFQNVYAEEESAKAKLHNNEINYYAGRFALKEAAFKALRTSWDKNMAWNQIVVREENSGAPYIVFKDAMLKEARRLGVTSVTASLSSDGNMVIAFVQIKLCT